MDLLIGFGNDNGKAACPLKLWSSRVGFAPRFVRCFVGVLEIASLTGHCETGVVDSSLDSKTGEVGFLRFSLRRLRILHDLP